MLMWPIKWCTQIFLYFDILSDFCVLKMSPITRLEDITIYLKLFRAYFTVDKI